MGRTEDSTVTASGRPLAPLDQPIPVPTLTVVASPRPDRVGLSLRPRSRPIPLDRVSEVFPGGALDDPGLSRRHAVLEPLGDGAFRLRDLGSKNGTRCDGIPVTAEGVRLPSRAVIRLGETCLLWQETLVPSPGDADIPTLAGTSDAARTLRASVARLARLPGAVLLVGETGTGKEVVARALASLGRPDGAFVPFNSATVPPGLVDATLFGCVKGAFTDAKEARDGLFRAASGGTLFLDEVLELPLETQAKLLRVLEDRTVMPVGATRPVPVDVRVVAATNRDPVDAILADTFRRDLYARLAVFGIDLPPLRDRLTDLPALLSRFCGDRPAEADLVEALLLHPWPLNVRELRAVAEVALAESPARGPLRLVPAVRDRLAANRRLARQAPERGPSTAPAAEAGQPQPALDRDRVEDALAQAGGNMSRAAEELGKDRGQFYRIVKRLGLDPGRFRKGEGGREG